MNAVDPVPSGDRIHRVLVCGVPRYTAIRRVGGST
jgi:hypothetical protein